ncbi:MAG TPA: type III PLP-dependent enzyme [Polyangia bacterium]|nr:type III PLP-dependent enzyme [Polyangia bacterium]
MLDCDQVRASYRRLSAALPDVDLHYAMKALAHPAVIATLDQEGSFFDVSAPGEIDLLRALDIDASRLVHTHPIKRGTDIRHAVEAGCRIFVVDNPDEMDKFVPYGERVSLLLRIGFRGHDALVDLAKKFGCAPEDAFALLQRGRRLGLSLCGLTFHVGSQSRSAAGHVAAIQACLALIERAADAGLPEIRLLDIGGGFPAPYRLDTPAIENFCAPIRGALNAAPRSVRIIAEPGRYLAATAMEVIATVVGKARRGGVFWYYLDDGVYGSFSGQVYDGARYPLRLLSEHGGSPHPSVLAGPTCDSIDVIAENLALPELEIGDLVIGGTMGAYTAASASEFNSIPKTKIVVLNAPPTTTQR